MTSMYRGRVLRIFETLQKVGATSAELLEIFILDRGTHYRRLRGLEFPRYKKRASWNPDYESKEREGLERHRLHTALTKLRRQNFIQRAENKKLARWNITAKGLQHFKKLQDAVRLAFPSKNKYTPQAANEWKIIIFDIPERERRKRAWLRSVLTHLKFKRLQKSVFIGKIAIPENFLKDLQHLHMLDYVEIFAITRSGTIRQIGPS